MADGDDLVLGMPNASTKQTHVVRNGSGSLTAFSVANLNGGGIVGTSSTMAPGRRWRSASSASANPVSPDSTTAPAQTGADHASP